MWSTGAGVGNQFGHWWIHAGLGNLHDGPVSVLGMQKGFSPDFVLEVDVDRPVTERVESIELGVDIVDFEGQVVRSVIVAFEKPD